MLKEGLFRLAKGPCMGVVVGNAFRYCSWALPVKKVYSSREVIAFCHPRPSYKNHIILSPKRAVRSLQQMALDGLGGYVLKIWEAAKELSETHPEYRESFVMVANGGKRQEVQQVHFHMFTHHAFVNEYAAQLQAEKAFYRNGDVCVWEHPNPEWEIHFVASPDPSLSMAGDDEARERYFRGILHCIEALNDPLGLVQKGYSLVYRYDGHIGDVQRPVFHIVSGKKRSSHIPALLPGALPEAGNGKPSA